MCSFKYSTNLTEIKWRLKMKMSLHVIDKPESIPDSAIREGMFLTRNKYGGRRVFYYYQNVWYLSHRSTSDKLEYLRTWNLIPYLTEREWKVMSSIPLKRLSTKWKLYVMAHSRALEINECYRRSKVIRFATIKK